MKCNKDCWKKIKTNLTVYLPCINRWYTCNELDLDI